MTILQFTLMSALFLAHCWLLGHWLWHKMRRRPQKPLETRFTCSYRLVTEDSHTSGSISYGWVQTWEGEVPIPAGLDPVEARNHALLVLSERFGEPRSLVIRIEKEIV